MEKHFKHDMLEHYRKYVNGLCALNELEQNALQAFKRLEHASGEYKEYELLRLHALQIFHTTHEAVRKTIDSFRTLLQFIESKGNKVSDFKSVERVFEQAIHNPVRRALILFEIHHNDGVLGLFAEQANRYEQVETAYEEIAVMLDESDLSSFASALERLLAYYKTLANIKKEYEERLRKAKEQDSSGIIVFSTYMSVALELCNQHPQVAKDLGVDCNEVFKYWRENTPHDMACWHPAVCIVALIVLACIRFC